MGSLHPSTSKPINILVIGAGSRGTAYARAITHLKTATRVAAIAEPDPVKRSAFGRAFISGWPDGTPGAPQSFAGWEQWVAWETNRRSSPSPTSTDVESISAVLICTLDSTHHPIILALAPLNLHILCEKPLALSLTHCLSIQTALSQYPPKILSIGHVLRYSPHNILLRKLVCDDLAVGEISSIEHTEPVGWWHFAHSYVRGNWRRETPEGVGSLLSKSCHDIDWILWMLCSPSKLTGSKPHEPSTVSSVGARMLFRKSRKPKAAGPSTNCLRCPLQDEGCVWSAKKIYGNKLLKEKNTGWPVNIVVPDIEDVEDKEKALAERLSEDYDKTSFPDEEVKGRSWYGRCVYESDNDVVDDQTVVLSWAASSGGDEVGRGPKTALFHMAAPTQAQCERRGHIYGSEGEIQYDSQRISVYTFADNQTRVYTPDKAIEVGEGHGGGDFGLAGNFVRAVEAAETGKMGVSEAQGKWIGCDVDEVVRSHGLVFAAEESRREGRVVRWGKWWEGKHAEKGYEDETEHDVAEIYWKK